MAQKKILLVEDEAVTAMDLKSNLLSLGYEVPAVVSTGEDAIRLTSQWLPDLILMDVTLDSRMTGIEAAEEIRKNLAIPIIFLTAHADAETIGKAKATEPFGYLPKPCPLDTLMSTIEVALYKSEADEKRRKAEKAVRESEEKYRIVADFTNDWEFWIGPDERILYTSPSCEKVTGYSAAAFTQDPTLIRRLIHPDDRKLYDEHRHEAKKSEAAEELEFRIIRPDGAIRWISHVCQAVYDTEGNFSGTRGSNRDITCRKNAEQERERLIRELREALTKVKLLSGLLPICSSCKKIRDDTGYWQLLEEYIRNNSEAEFTHGICPDCAYRLYPEFYAKLYPDEEPR